MQSIWLLIAAGLGLLLGLLFIKSLTAHPTQMGRFLSAAWISLFLLILVLARALPGEMLLYGLLLSGAGFAAGYAWMTASVLGGVSDKPLPALTRTAEGPNLGHTAVIYFTHGEPETYDPRGWIKQFKEFDEEGIPFIPWLVRPFFIRALRERYLSVGRSEHGGIHRHMLASLEKAYRLEGDRSTRFYTAFLDDDPTPEAAAIQALNEGAGRILVAEVFLTVSNHTAEGQERIRSLQAPERLGVPVTFTGPLHDSSTLQRMFVARANAFTGSSPKERTGILLVGHGQPDEWDKMWPTETEQEMTFRHGILDLLEADGYRRENMSLAWAAFKQPRPRAVIPQFQKNGIEKLLYFPAAISADAIISQYDIPQLIHEVRFPEGFPVVNMGAWNDDPLVIQAIKEKLDPWMK